MEDETPDLPLDNFGGATEVPAPPAEEESATDSNQTTQPTEGSGSEEEEQPKTENAEPKSEDNSKPEEASSQRPEKKDRLQNRFGELTGKIKTQEAQIAEYEAMIARTNAMQGVKPLQAGEDGQYSIEAIQQNQAQLARAEAQAEVQVLRQQIEREQVANRMDAEGAEIEKLLESKGLTNELHTANIRAEIEERIALAGYNTQALKQISPKVIADRYVKAIESERRAATTESAQNVQNLQAEQAVAPNAPASEELDEDAALEARLAEAKF